MRIHRFHVPERLSDALTVSDGSLVHQWKKVLRIPEGGSLRLFDGRGIERLYILEAYTSEGTALLRLEEDLLATMPERPVTLFFSLLKKDKNEWVIQKCTEIGVSRFVPIVAERTEKTGFPRERIAKIAIEASEQCGRADIPEILEPMTVDEAIAEFGPSMELYVCDEGDGAANIGSAHAVGYFVGPEGGWTEEERQRFAEEGIKSVALGRFTLRAETACIAAALVFSTARTRKES